MLSGLNELVLGKKYRLITKEELINLPNYEDGYLEGDCQIVSDMERFLGTEVIISHVSYDHRTLYFIRNDKHTFVWPIYLFKEITTIEDIYRMFR